MSYISGIFVVDAPASALNNAGQDNVDRWRRDGGGIRFAETRAYVHRVEDLPSTFSR